MGSEWPHGESEGKPSTWLKLMAERKEKIQNEQWKPLIYHGGTQGKDLVQLMKSMDAIPPSKSEQKMIGGLLTNGNEIVFSSIICPDYSTENQNGEVRYTFNSLGGGIGVVATRALEVHTLLSQFFAKQIIKNQPRFMLIMADQEANDQNCQRVGLSRTEFVDKLRQSQEALVDQANHYGVSIETPFLTELDPTSWHLSKVEAKSLVSRVSRGLLESALRVRRRLYERWAGKMLDDNQAMAILLVQVEEYIAVGRYLSSPERIIIGLDPPVMSHFVRHGAGQTPVIYFKRPDY